MTAVIYARYSSDNQREESIEGQIRECTAYAEKNGITIVKHYIDRALSAKTDNRPEFQQMIKDSEKRLFDIVLVWKLDRFARNRYDSAHYEYQLERNHVKLVSATEPISEGPAGIMVKSMLTGMAEYYSAELSEKVVRGMTENVLKGKYNGGTIPIGYTVDEEKFFQIDPLKAPFVVEVFQRYNDGATMKELMNWLNDSGVTTNRNQKFTYNSIQTLLTNRRYIGENRFKDIVMPDSIPVIIEKELFDSVQDKIAKNRRAPARHKAEDDYLLTTKLFCGMCGAMMFGECGTSRNKNVHHYYKCANAKRTKTCKKKTVRKEWLEDLVVNETMKMIRDDDSIQSIVDAVMILQEQENTVLPLLEKQMKDIENGIENLLNAIQAGVLTSSTKGRLEMRNLDIYYKPLPGLAFQTDTYILDGKQGTFTPDFTYHGFQYVEVRSDRPVKLTKESLTAQFIHTAVPPVGKFSCSNELLNKIWKAANQSYLSNLMSIPTDCPQREKNGWTADAHITMDLGLLNFDGITFYEKWLDDMIDNQNEEGRISGIIPSSGWGYDDWIGPVWDAAMFIVPMAIYHYYGDTRSIEKLWPVCTKYLAYLAGREDAEGTVTYGIGDWVFHKTQTPTEFTTTCYYYLDNLYMAKFAELIGKDGSSYAKKAEELKLLINHKYFDTSKAIYANGSQAAQGVALYLGIVPKEYEQQVADNLSTMIKANKNLLDFGVLGSKTVLRMLSKYGYADLAYQMAAQEEAPSWGNWIKQGFTTLAETWILSPEFRDASVNHMFLGDINAWMYNILAGINYDEQKPGFKHILLRPNFPSGLNEFEARYQSPYGEICSKWERKKNRIVYHVTVPANSTATFYAPDNVKGERAVNLEAGKHILELPIKRAVY